MTTRITDSDLRNAVDRLNRCLGYPLDPCIRDENGVFVRAVPGMFRLSRGYGMNRLVQIVTREGGEDNITPFLTKRELLGRIESMEQGVYAAVKAFEHTLAAGLRNQNIQV